MAVTFVQADDANDAGPFILNGVATGNTVCAWIAGHSSMATTAMPAGWSKLTPVVNVTYFAGCWWVYPNHPGGSISETITNPPDFCGWSSLEFAGVDGSSPVEHEVSNIGISTTWSVSNVDVSEGSSLVCGAGEAWENPYTMTETGVGLAIRTIQSTCMHATFSLDNMVAGSYSPSGSAAPSADTAWVAIGLALRSQDPREGDRPRLDHLFGR